MILPGFPRPMVVHGGGFDPSTPLGTFTDGGYFLGQVTDNGKAYAIIVSPFADGGASTTLVWGPSGTTGFTSLYNGPANTAGLVALAGSYPAAEFCAGLLINGFGDWYLPAKEEFQVVYNNRSYLPAGQTLNTGNHWSSSESSGGDAWAFFVIGNSWSVIGKTTELYLRAIRRVPMA